METSSEIKTSDLHDIPAGFSFAGISCGIKASGKTDLALIVAGQACRSFGAFTQNIIRASSVDWNETHIGSTRAVIINSGNANACTGHQGEVDTQSMADETARLLGCPPEQVLVMSTGIIGEKLPMEKVVSGIHQVAAAHRADGESLASAANGFLTTDKFPKVVSGQFTVNERAYSILGIAKGAGMIGPKMATLLGVVTTDFPLADSPANKLAFRKVIDQSFNRISVDGHTSTSDQVVLLSSGDSSDPESDAATAAFFAELQALAIDLAKMIPRDGEGATHLVSITVSGPQSEEELAIVAKTIADSPLVKTAVFGGDPNWGRIVSAAGYSGVEFSPATTSLTINGYQLFANGTPVEFDDQAVSESIRENVETEIHLQIGNPDQVARFWTSDLTYDYVKINAEYHT